MEVILVLLIVAVLNGAVAYIDEMLQELVPMTLYADRYMLAANGGSMVDVLFDILLGFGVSMIILKFLKKGFECYVMWTDGDPDTEPAGLVIRFMQAVAVAVCFPIVYGWMAEITQGLIDDLMAGVGKRHLILGTDNSNLRTHLCCLLFYPVFPVPDEGTGNHDSADWDAYGVCGASG